MYYQNDAIFLRNLLLITAVAFEKFVYAYTCIDKNFLNRSNKICILAQIHVRYNVAYKTFIADSHTSQSQTGSETTEKAPFLVEPVRLTPAWEESNLPNDELNFKGEFFCLSL